MRSAFTPRLLAALLTIAASGLPATRASAGTVDPALKAAVAGMKPGVEVAVVVSFSDRVPLGSFAPRGLGRKAAGGELVRALRAKAAATQGPFLSTSTALGGHGAVSLWAVNAVALTIRNELVTALARQPGVESVRLDAVVDAPVAPKAPPVAARFAATATAPAEWNVQALGAPDLWSAGKTGAGAVVAALPSGSRSHWNAWWIRLTVAWPESLKIFAAIQTAPGATPIAVPPALPPRRSPIDCVPCPLAS